MTDARRYSRIVLIVSLVLVTVLMSLWGWIYHRVFDINRTNYFLKNDVTQNWSDDMPKTLIVGDSRSIQLDPLMIEELGGGKMYNISSGGVGIVYAYYALKRILDQGHTPEKVYILISEGNEGRFTFDEPFAFLFVNHFVTLREMLDMVPHVPDIWSNWLATRPLGSLYFRRDAMKVLRENPDEILGNIAGRRNDMLRKTQEHHRGFRIKSKEYSLKEVDGETIYDFSNANESIKNMGEKATWQRDGRVMGPAYIYAEKTMKVLDDAGVDYEFFLSHFSEKKAQMSDNFGFYDVAPFAGWLPQDRFNRDILILPNEMYFDWNHINSAGVRPFAQWFVDYVVKDGPSTGGLYPAQLSFIEAEESPHNRRETD